MLAEVLTIFGLLALCQDDEVKNTAANIQPSEPKWQNITIDP